MLLLFVVWIGGLVLLRGLIMWVLVGFFGVLCCLVVCDFWFGWLRVGVLFLVFYYLAFG